MVESSVERLILAGPNYNVTFNGPPVVRAVAALLDVLAEGATRADAVRQASARSEQPPKLLEYAFDLLESNACLYSSEVPDAPGDALDRFIAFTGQDPDVRKRRLAANRALLVVPADMRAELESSFQRAGIVLEALELGRESEIAAGNALGMPTVQTLRPGVPPAVNAQWRIRNLAELSKLIPKIHSTPSQ